MPLLIAQEHTEKINWRCGSLVTKCKIRIDRQLDLDNSGPSAAIIFLKLEGNKK